MEAVLFDLDGTLFDTLEDIRSAINYALRAWDGSEASPDDVRRYVGRGLRRAMASAAAEHCPRLEEGEEELMFQLMPDSCRSIQIMLDYGQGRIVTLSDLTPAWWQ